MREPAATAVFLCPPREKGHLCRSTHAWSSQWAEPSALARYLISVAALSISRELPWGTIGINVLGSFVIGFVGTLTLPSGRYPWSQDLRLFVMVGLCGGFTTFSAFSLQTLDLMRSGAFIRAGLNIVISVVLCVAAVAAGHLLAASYNDGAWKIAQIDIEEEA